MPVITMLTDFGTRDEYVGVVKGVILNINPAVTLVDITHEIPPQDILAGAYTLAAAFAYFPKTSIHLVVVDPGVGSDREIIGARLNGHIFVAPDNGVLTKVFEQYEAEEIVRVTNAQYFLYPVSHTFHGRDIFAPVAAHLSKGISLAALGPSISIEETVRLSSATPESDTDGNLVGRVIAVDRFGNLTTNIRRQHIDAMVAGGVAAGAAGGREAKIMIEIGGRRIFGLSTSYAQVPKGEPLAIIGSRRCLEVAVREGNAAEVLHLEKETLVRLCVLSAEGLGEFKD